MNLQILLSLSSVIFLQVLAKEELAICDGVTIKGVYHDKETIVSHRALPFFLDIDRSSNELYSSYWMQEPSRYGLAKINLETKEVILIPEVSSSFVYAIDHERKVIYLEGVDGIYKHDTRMNITTLYYRTKGDGIRRMYYNKALYFTTSPDSKLHVCKEGQCSLFEGLDDSMVTTFVVDDDNVVYFRNYTGLFKKGTGNAILIKKHLGPFTSLALDSQGQLYVSAKAGVLKVVYLVNKGSLRLEKLFDHFYLGYEFTFDRHGNFIFSDLDTIYRLIPNKDKTC